MRRRCCAWGIHNVRDVSAADLAIRLGGWWRVHIADSVSVPGVVCVRATGRAHPAARTCRRRVSILNWSHRLRSLDPDRREEFLLRSCDRTISTGVGCLYNRHRRRGGGQDRRHPEGAVGASAAESFRTGRAGTGCCGKESPDAQVWKDEPAMLKRGQDRRRVSGDDVAAVCGSRRRLG